LGSPVQIRVARLKTAFEYEFSSFQKNDKIKNDT